MSFGFVGEMLRCAQHDSKIQPFASQHVILNEVKDLSQSSGYSGQNYSALPACVLPHFARIEPSVSPSPTGTRVARSFSPTLSASPAAARRASSSSVSG
jgi:hypothetical protein